MTSISNSIKTLPNLSRCVCGGGGGGGGGTYFAFKTFFIHVRVNTDQNEQTLWPN